MPGLTLDVFNGDAFSFETLTAAVQTMPYVPGQAGRLGIFSEEGVSTNIISVERLAGILTLIPDTPRGGVGNQVAHNKANLRNFSIPHLVLEDAIQSSEIQGVRVFGSNDQMQAVQAVIDKRYGWMFPRHDATAEYGRIGSIKGIIYDADGATVQNNLFTEFGVAQNTEDFDLGNADSDIITHAENVLNYTEDELGQATYDHIHCFLGKVYWQRFITHPKVVAAYTYFQANQQKFNPLRDDLRYVGFEFGGIIWEKYRGNVGGIPFVADSESHFFPVGVQDLFITRFGPGDFLETANTIGLPRYAKIAPDREWNRSVKLLTESNPVSLCTRPEVLTKGITGS